MNPIYPAVATRDLVAEREPASRSQASAESPRPPSTFVSVLFPGSVEAVGRSSQPDCFEDLHLDQIVARVTAGRDEYDLVAFFHQPLDAVEAIKYRHEVVRDLAQPEVRKFLGAFAAQMVTMRRQLELTRTLTHRLQKQRWFLSAASVYADAVCRLGGDLRDAPLTSAALVGLREYVRDYVRSGGFERLRGDAREVTDELAAARYAIQTQGARVKVLTYEPAADLSAKVEQTFARFRQGAVKDYRVRFPQGPALDHVEEQILDRVALVHRQTFASLEQFCGRYASCFEPTIIRFDREIQFYLGYLEHVEALAEHGLSFCLPEVDTGIKEVRACESFDLSLAAKLAAEATRVVCNDFELSGVERVLVVTGPNQGGKTTFARMVGQLHYLASLGLPVPGRRARLALVDRVFTHFEREESLKTMRGKFEDELVRIHEILDQATGDSLLVMNESFGSTSLQDAREIGAAIIRQIITLDALCVFVSFVDDLASLSGATVSLMSIVDPADPARRTFTIARKPADGLAYAVALAEKYGLTYDALSKRIRP